MSQARQHIHFVTGRLAEQAVRRTVERVAQEVGFEYSIGVMPITVAALMTSKWLLRHIEIPPEATSVLLPGYLDEEREALREQLPVDVDIGPRDIRDLPLFFGQKSAPDKDYGKWSTEIIAEINHAPRLSEIDLVGTAKQLVSDGANIVDLGCSPGHRWLGVADSVKRLRDEGIRVSIDSFDTTEVRDACEAGAELVLSVNSSNREAAVDWGTEVVVIPDTPRDEKSFQETEVFLAQQRVSTRLDPILEPLGCGFAQSLMRYARCRKDYPEARMMMGIGNITELTDVDSSGVNVLLLGICQELGINSVLTTEVINWSRTSVQECDLARRLVHYACTHSIPPKHLEPSLVLLRDESVNEFDLQTLEALAQSIRDNNVRIFNSEGKIHAISAGVHAWSDDPFEVMRQLLSSPLGDTITAGHAFYLGFEMSKALTANTLSKRYEQDQALNWGYLTRPEDHHRLDKR